jgi:hypothetical protein
MFWVWHYLRIIFSLAFTLYLCWPFLLFTLSTWTQNHQCCNVMWNSLERKETVLDYSLWLWQILQHCLMTLLTYQVFDEYIQIRKHVRAFHGGRRFPCGLCEKEFPRPDKLKLHMLRCPALVAASSLSSSVLFARSFFILYFCMLVWKYMMTCNCDW